MTMNQDQARRWAEEVELPQRVEDVLVFTSGTCHALKKAAQFYYTESQVREAIAAALVKLTQGQEPVSPRVTPEMLAELQHNLDVVAKAHNKHIEIGQKYSLTDPAPSQQEEPHPPHRHCGCAACLPSFNDNATPPSQQEDRKPRLVDCGECHTQGCVEGKCRNNIREQQ